MHGFIIDSLRLAVSKIYYVFLSRKASRKRIAVVANDLVQAFSESLVYLPLCEGDIDVPMT